MDLRLDLRKDPRVWRKRKTVRTPWLENGQVRVYPRDVSQYFCFKAGVWSGGVRFLVSARRVRWAGAGRAIWWAGFAFRVFYGVVWRGLRF